jgi:single-strand DNA-binding protein
MATYNKIIIIGNLTRDPEYKQLPSGQGVCRLGVASNRQYKNKMSGDAVQEVCFIDVDVFGAQAESCRQYLQKGRPVLIDGRLKYDTWDTQSGEKRSKHSIVAERVQFMGSAQEYAGAERYEEPTPAMGGLNPNDPTERKLMDQIEEIKAKTTKKAAPKKEEIPTKAGEIDFSDVPPFQDDLPF